jgi:glyoxylase-like metal-dependent hydrolase (beta-lactamase superfamily II)
VIIAHGETYRLLKEANDPNRPLPTVTFEDELKIEIGSEVLELSYQGLGHSPGNIFIAAPKQRTLMVVDVVFPGWMPWRRLALAQNVAGYFDQVESIDKWDFDTFVGGHVGRAGTRADVAMQLAFINDLKAAAQRALQTTTPGDGLNPLDRGNPWAIYDHFIDRVAVSCVNELTPKWSTKLAAFDVYIWDQCYAMEQSLRID